MAARPQFSQIAIAYPDWEPEYRAALNENDPEQLHDRIRSASLALFNRSQIIGYKASPERSAMRDATITLRALISHKLGHPKSA